LRGRAIKSVFEKALVVQAVLAAAAVLATLGFVGVDCAIGAAAGGIVSALDFAVIALAASNLAAGPLRSRMFYTIALGVKLPIVAGIVFVLVWILNLNVLGLLIGFSTMVLSVLYAGVAYQRTLLGES